VKQILCCIIAGICCLAINAGAEDLSLDQQRDIIEHYMHATGQTVGGRQAAGSDETAEARHAHDKCGTAAIMRFQRNYDKLDRALLQELGVQAVERPEMQYAYDSPGGRIRIHYDKTGIHAVYQAGLDADGDGTPDYIESFAIIADSCYDLMTGYYGYPHPIADTICTSDGGDDRVDIYLRALSAGYYGLTYAELECGADPIWKVPSWVVLENDFAALPEYRERPLDAARVTLAHELFHTVHFTLDASESITWFEMSAVWMEEAQYDDINDYYLYDEVFFDVPRRSIQSEVNAHHYASVVWPIYLSETFGTDIIRRIWQDAADRGIGQDFLISMDSCIYSADTTMNLHSAFAEFAVWNYFTGPYAEDAPNDMGYSEKANLAYIPTDSIDHRREYRFLALPASYAYRPQVNAATYLRLDDLDLLSDSSWTCNSGSFDNNTCTDSTAFADSVLSVLLLIDQFDAGRWGVSAIYQLADNPDSHVVETVVALGSAIRNRDLTTVFGHPIDYRDYRSITLVLTPTTVIPDEFREGNTVAVGYSNRNWTEVGANPDTIFSDKSGILTPYPNPAVVSQMDGADMKFAFEVTMGGEDDELYSNSHVVVDIFTVAGERVRTVEGQFQAFDRSGTYSAAVYDLAWDMKNQSGNEVASGAYLAYARLYQGTGTGQLLADDRVKIAVIR